MKFWTSRWAGAIVVAIVIAVYAPTLVFQRVDFDDPWLWSDDSPLREISADTLHLVFFEMDTELRQPLGHEYLPVRDVAVAIDMAVWGDNEHGPHATQLALFALTVFGLGGLLIRFGFARHVAWLGALVWAIHPVRVESVAWLSERKGVLAGLFVIAVGHAWVRYRNGRSVGWLVAGALAAIAGTWSKAPAMFAPAAFLALDLILLPRDRRRWIATLVIGAATALAAVPVLIVARDARIIDNTDAPTPGRIASSLGAEGHYVQGLVLARPVATNYPIQTDGPAPLDLAIGAIGIAGSLGLAWCWRRKPQPLALLAWTYVWFVPISQLVVPVHILVADRFVYLWSIGPMVGLVLALDRIPRVRAPLAVLLVAGLSVITLRAEEPWTSSIELFTHALDSNPGDPLAYRSLAMAQDMIMHARQALATVDRGLAAHPDNTKLILAKAFVLDSLNRHADAEAYLVTAIAKTGRAASLEWTLSRLMLTERDFAGALPHARIAYDKHPELTDYASQYGMLLNETGHPELALPVLQGLRHAEVRDHFELGRALWLLGRNREAEVEFARARAITPGIAGEIERLQRR